MLREIIRKALSKFIFPNTYSSLFMPRTRFNYAKEVNGWQSSIIMACVGWIQRTFPEAPLMVEKRNQDGEWEEVLDNPLIALLDNPNPYYDGLLLQSAFIADLVISGNAYLLKVRSGAGRPVQLWWTPSTLIEPKWPQDGSEFLSHYNYTPGGSQIKIDPKDVVHYRMGIDPDNLRKGRSPLQSLLREVFTDDEAANMTATLLRNMGVPGLLISPEKDATVSPQDADAVKAYVKERTTGDRRGEPLVLTAATKVDAFGFTPQQMDLKALRRIPEERISAVLGIPAIVAGLGAGLDRSTFANMAEAREMAYESGIIPLQRIVGSQTKHQLLSEFEDDLINYRVTYDLSEIRVLQEDQNKLATRIGMMVSGGYLKIQDAQRIMSIPVDDTQDFYLRSFTALTVRSGETGNEQLAPQGEKSLKSSDWSDEQKTAHWKRIDRRRISWWDVLQKRFEPLYKQIGREAITAIEGKDSHLIERARTAIGQMAPGWETVITTSASALIEDFGNAVAEDLGSEPIKSIESFELKWRFDPTKPAIRSWLKKHAAENVKTILDTQKEAMGKLIAKGVEDNLSTTQIAKSIRTYYDDNSKYLSMRVARSEVATASGYGSVAAAEQSGVAQTKTWLSSRDDRVRDSHQQLDGESIPMGELFSNGLEYPGDQRGDPEESIMCRCVLTFHSS